MSTGGQLRAGCTAIGQGFRFLAGHPSLWPWALLPFAIQMVVFIALAGMIVGHFDTLYDHVAAFFPSSAHVAQEGTGGMILKAALWVVELVLRAMLGILAFILLLLFTFVIGLIIAGPFNDLLSERTEHLACGRQGPPFQWAHVWKGITRALLVELQKAAFLVGIPVLFFPLHLIPVVGNIIALVATALFAMWATGFAFADYPQGRRLHRFAERLQFARRRAVALLAFGSVLWIPGLVIFCSAPLIVGGTLLYLNLATHEGLDGRPAVSP